MNFDIYILKSYEYSMLLDKVHNYRARRDWQQHFIKQAGNYLTFKTRIGDTIFLHLYKIPSVWGAREGHKKINKIIRAIKAGYNFKCYQRFADGELLPLSLGDEPRDISDLSHAIIITSQEAMNDLQCNYIARKCEGRKFLKPKHKEQILSDFKEVF